MACRNEIYHLFVRPPHANRYALSLPLQSTCRPTNQPINPAINQSSINQLHQKPFHTINSPSGGGFVGHTRTAMQRHRARPQLPCIATFLYVCPRINVVRVRVLHRVAFFCSGAIGDRVGGRPIVDGGHRPALACVFLVR